MRARIRQPSRASARAVLPPNPPLIPNTNAVFIAASFGCCLCRWDTVSSMAIQMHILNRHMSATVIHI